MQSVIKEWIVNIIVCSILFSVILYLTPDPRMKKYIQTAIGFVMMIVVLTPVIGWLRCDNRMTFSMYAESLGNNITGSDDEMYVDLMETVVQNFLRDSLGVESDVQITLTGDMSDRVEISRMQILLTEVPTETEGALGTENTSKTVPEVPEPSVPTGRIKKALAEEYGIDDRIIEVR